MLFPTGVSRVLSAAAVDRFSTTQTTSHAASGTPALSGSSALAAPLLGARRCATLGVCAAFAADSIALWSVRPHVLLATVRRTDTSLAEEGPNADVQFAEDGSRLAVSTARGLLVVYDVVVVDDTENTLPVADLATPAPPQPPPPPQSSTHQSTIHPTQPRRRSTARRSALKATGSSGVFFRSARLSHAYQPRFADDTQTVEPGPGEDGGAVRVGLQLRVALRIAQGIRCLAPVGNHLMVFTCTNASLVLLDWSGSLLPSSTVSLRTLSFVGADTSAVTHVAPCGSPDLLAWISEAGCAYLVRRARVAAGDGTEVDRTASERSLDPGDHYAYAGTCFYNQDMTESRATAVAFNPEFSLLALGTESGEVFVYSLSDDGRELNFEHLCLPGRNPGAPDRNLNLGPVQCLRWSPDGTALAVGWSEFGLSIWTTYGRLIAISKSEEMIESRTPSADYHILEDYIRGVVDMFWSEGGYELFVVPYARGLGTWDTHGSEIHVIPFLRSSASLNSSIGGFRRTFLVSDEVLLLYKGNSHSVDIMDMEISPWETVQLPLMYTSVNWPILSGATDALGKYIALAGARGLTYYNSKTGKWKLFGNEEHEARFVISGGMHFIGQRLLVCACEDFSFQEPAFFLRCFECDNNLDLDNTVFSRRLKFPVLSITGFHTNIMTYSVDNVIRHYSLHKEKNKWDGSFSYGLILAQEISLDTVVRNPTAVRYIGWSSISLSNELLAVVQKIYVQRKQRGASSDTPPYSDLFDDSISKQGLEIRNVLKTTPIAMLYNGELSILRGLRQPGSTDDTSWEMVALADKMEYCSVLRPTDMVSEMQMSLWGFNSSGVVIWTGVGEKRLQNVSKASSLQGDEDPENQQSSESIETIPGNFEEFGKEWTDPLRIPLDFAAFNVLPHRGIISGLEIVPTPSVALSALYFKIEDKTTLFIPKIVRYFLDLDTGVSQSIVASEKDQSGLSLGSPTRSEDRPQKNYRKEVGYRRAYRFAREFSDLPYFNHALEILLHQALDADLDLIARERKRRAASKASMVSVVNTVPAVFSQRNLPRVASFVKEFPDYLDVVVQCARKIDVSAWSTLFSTVGNPIRLFSLCIHEGRLQTAINYLIVLQSLETTFISGNCTAILLERACEMQDFDTLQAVVGFLSGIEGSDGSVYAYVISDYAKVVLANRDVGDGTDVSYSASLSASADNEWIPQPNGKPSKYSLNAIGTMEYFFDRHPEFGQQGVFGSKVPSSASLQQVSPTGDAQRELKTVKDAIGEFAAAYRMLMTKRKESEQIVATFARIMN